MGDLSLPGGAPSPATLAPLLTALTVIASSGASQALATTASGPLDPSYDITLTAACALTLSGVATGRLQTITAILRQDATGGRVVTLPSTILWPNGVVPTLNQKVGYVDVLQFCSVDGVNWFGSAVSLSATAASLTLTAITGTYYAGNTITVSGTFIGSAPTSLDYAIDGGAWSAAGATISNGTFSFTMSAPAAGNHNLQVRNDGAQSEVSASSAFTVAAPAVPSSPAIGISVGAGQNTINMAASTNGSNVTSFQVFRGTSAGGEGATPIGTVSSGITNTANAAFATYVDTTAANGTTYYYTFKAVNGVGTQASASAEVSGTPNATSPVHYLNMPSSGQSGYGSAAAAPGSAANDAQGGGVDGTIFLAPGAASYSKAVNLIGKYSYDTTGGNSSWHLNLGGGYFGLEAYDPSSNFKSYYVAPPSAWAASKPIWLHFVINNSGSAYTDEYGITTAANTFAIYYSSALNRPTNSAGWTLLGQNAAGNSGGLKAVGTNQGLSLGAYSISSNPTSPLTGQYYSAYVQDLLGNILVDVDFTGQATGATKIAEQPPGTQTWSVSGNATQA